MSAAQPLISWSRSATEELPPKSLLALRDRLCQRHRQGLTEAGLSHKAVEKFATPRRLAVRVRKLVERQPDRAIERRGRRSKPLSMRKARPAGGACRSPRAAASK